MATQVRNVQFAGTASDLRALIGKWNVLRGVSVKVRQTDYVGGSFDVEFGRDEGKVTDEEADRWVVAAMSHVTE